MYLAQSVNLDNQGYRLGLGHGVKLGARLEQLVSSQRNSSVHKRREIVVCVRAEMEGLGAQ